MSLDLWIGPVILAAVISGLINVAGWVITFRQARRLERDRREEKVIDLQSALLAEIRSDLQALRDVDFDRDLAELSARLRAPAEDGSYTPFVPRESDSPIFSAIVQDIAVLPNAVIDPVVLYYRQRETIANFTEDLRAERFSALPQERKLAMMTDYLRLKAYAGQLAADAGAALERSLGLPASISNRAEDRSARQSASAE